MIKPPSILIVDDEMIITEFLRQVLEARGYRIAGVATSGEDAIRLVEKNRPDIILMDIILDGAMDGIEASEKIRERWDIPVVYLTGNPQEQNLARVKFTMPFGYIVKPVNGGEVHSAIEIALYKHGMERKLRESEGRFRTVVESATDGICVVKDGLIKYINPALERIVGFTREDRGDADQPFELYIHPDERDRVAGMYGRFMKGEDNEQHYETALMDRDGRRIEVELKASWMEDYDGGRAALVFIRDITAQKLAESQRRAALDALRESEERFRIITENSPIPIVITELDGMVIYANHMAEKVFDIDRKDALGKMYTADYYVDPADRDRLIRSLRDSGGVSGMEVPLYRRDRSVIRGLFYMNLITFENRKVVLTAFDDITEFLDAQRNLRFTRFAVDRAADAAFWMKADGTITYVNDAACRMLGYAQEELAGLKIDRVVCSLTNGEWPHHWENLKKDGSTTMHSEHMTKSGARVPVEMTINYLSYENEEYAIAFSRDISERIKFEEALWESRTRLYEIIHFLPLATFAVDREGRVIAWNRAIEQMSGVKEEEILGKGDYEYALPFYGVRRPIMIDLIFTEESRIAEKYDSVSREGDSIYGETELVMRDGRKVYLWGKASPLYDSRGDVAGAIESIRDITDYKRAEMALKASEERYRAMTEASPDAITVVDMDLTIVYASPRSVELHGYGSADEMKGMKGVALVPHDVRGRAMTSLDRYMKAGLVHAEEYRILRKDGRTFEGEISAALIRDAGGKPSSWIVITRDITERKSAEEAIRLSEEKFSKAFMSSPLVVLIFDLGDGRFLEVNERFIELSGFSREEVIGRTPKELNIYADAESRDRLFREITDVGRVRDFEIDVRNRDGSVRQTMLSGDIISIEGKPRFIAIMVDVTEMKELQKEIATAIEQERQRIGRDLHDDLGQTLTGVTFLLQSLKHDLEGMDAALLSEVGKIDELVRSAVAKTRSISRMLSPVEMGETGLVAALTDMVQQIENIFVISCQFHCMEELTVRDSIAASNLFYIAREAATNALKHSNANRIDVYLRKEEDALVLEVQDDGTGIREGRYGKGLGLRIMHYRAGIIGAQIDFIKNEDGGFSVVVRKKLTETEPDLS